MFDIGIGWQELLIVVVLAIIIVGPKDLPKFIKQFAQFIKKAKSITSDLQGQLSDIAKEAELDEFRKNILDEDANLKAKNIMDPIKAVSEDIDKLLNDSEGMSTANMNGEADMDLIIDDEPMPDNKVEQNTSPSEAASKKNKTSNGKEQKATTIKKAAKPAKPIKAKVSKTNKPKTTNKKTSKMVEKA